MNHLPVVILAGGLATRLRPITEQIPKILVEVAGRPFAEHQIRLLKEHDLTEIILCVGYLGEQVRNVLGDGSKWGVRLRYAFDGPNLLGTGGAIRNVVDLLGDAFFVLYGDTYLDCEYLSIEAAFHESHKLGLMTAFHNNNQWDRSNILLRSGNIIRYDKVHKTTDMEHIDYGLSVLSSSIFHSYPAQQPFDLATVYQDLIEQGQMAGYEVFKRFYEIGSPSGLEETRRFLTQKTG